MKLKQIAVREMGRLRDEVSIAGLSAGMNILIAPNEAGKSTLFRALHTLFTMTHSSTAEKVRKLQPYSGGAPYGRVDFEFDGQTWQIEKQFLSSKSATLTNTTDGTIAARGKEADEILAAMLARKQQQTADATSKTSDANTPDVKTLDLSGGERFDLLWLDAPSSLDPAQLANGHALLRTAMEAGASAATGGGELDVMCARVAASLDDLLTKSRKTARKGGPLFTARQQAKVAQQELDEMSARASELEERKRAFIELNRQLETIRTTQTDRQLASELKLATEQLAAARKLREDMAKHEAVAQKARAECDLAESAHAAIENKHLQLAQLGEQIAACEAGLKDCDVKLKALGEQRVEATSKQSALQTALTELQAAAQHEQAEREVKLLTIKLNELGASHKAAQQAAQCIKETAARIADIPVDAAGLATLTQLHDAIARRQRDLAAGRAELSIELDRDAKADVRVNGTAIAKDGKFSVDEPITLEIEGVGTITVSPAQMVGSVSDDDQISQVQTSQTPVGETPTAETRQEAVARLATDKGKLSTALGNLKLPDIDAATQAYEQRIQLEQESEQAQRDLAMHAPIGLPELTEQIKRCEAELAERVSEREALPSVSETVSGLSAGDRATKLNDLESQALVQSETCAALESNHAELKAEQTRIETEYKSYKTTQLTLEEELGAKTDRAATRKNMLAAAESARKAYEKAEASLSGFGEAAPDDERLAELEQAESTAHKKRDEVRLMRQSLEAKIAEHKTVFAERKAEHIDDMLDVAAATHERASTQLQRLENEAAELSLLERVLQDAASDQLENLTQPVTQRMHPYIEQIFPGSRFSFDNSLNMTKVARDGAHEDMIRLSDGTREQIALIARLAYADLLADAGYPTPIILDDPLQKTDDTRMHVMFEALTRAAERHQIVILTCREAAFAPLQGTRLALAPAQNAAQSVVAAE